MSEIGAISSYVLAMQQLQLNVIKQQNQTEQQLAEMLLDASRAVSPSTDKGTIVDISI